MILFFLVIPICLIVLWSKYSKLKKAYAVAAPIAETVSDADVYSVEKHTEADNYYAGKHTEAEEFYEQKHRDGLDYYNKKVKNADERASLLKVTIESMTSEKQSLEQSLKGLELQVLIGSVKIDAYENLKSDEIKNKLALLHSEQDDMIKSDKALFITDTGATKRVADSQKKQILRCFNAESENIISSVTVKNVDASRAKIQRAFESINKMFTVDGVTLSAAYLESKFTELSLVYAYMVHEDEEREQRKAIREQMVEEEKVRREIEKEKQKIEKEEAQFTNEVNKLMAYMQQAKDDIERKLYIDKISALEEKLKALESDKENVLQREQNTRAGFVYIISNIGSFGERVFKIGMTRRLEPMDRISELSSASVPFPFDVHALIFSEDAPGLETILHQHFSDSRVNRVNSRKEFFRVDLGEIKKVVLKNHNATVKFVDIPDALEYRETVKLTDSSGDSLDAAI
ncbi:DUF4041 domain-containing protein [uncultured Oscillibacter sp.]|uniref:DUF4041 domain-containing protein n=1 Tax=uncultured Oscillibacter sp. TaxID=876091 RepID=UPI0025D0A7DB|nr:DUF4041 domain-containing protein [uncultured Oscillibacter sp.]